MILIDNYDSFTYNIVQYLKELGVNPQVFKNDEITIDELKKMNFSAIIISPGPKGPDQTGISLAVIKEFYKTKKILGVCLGHQCIAQFFGAKIVKSSEPVHGKTSKIFFTSDSLFEGLEQGFKATRYHSLIVDNESMPDCLIPIAFANVGVEIPTYCSDVVGQVCPTYSVYRLPFTIYPILMALKHKDYPVYGVQFHPEAILTQGGKRLLANFLEI
jgi:anthranilate synthase/aminodeoxychorismate synthase-like glutamine amidotransferase